MPRSAVPGQRQVQARRGRADEVGQVEDALPGPVVAAKPDQLQPGVVGGQLPQVRRVGAAEMDDHFFDTFSSLAPRPKTICRRFSPK